MSIGKIGSVFTIVINAALGVFTFVTRLSAMRHFVKRLKELERENAQLKCLVADQVLHI